jgi:tetratricopeptide (TPR) repeat protein
LGPTYFKENVGAFWGLLETRPYMRARLGLAETLFHAGRKDEAFDHWKAMLRLNPNDNQGVRHILAAEYANEARWDDLERLVEGPEYANDVAAEWCYAKVLLRFLRTGNSEGTRKALTEALRYNRHVPDYLCGRKPIVDDSLDRVTLGGEDEAASAAGLLLRVWRRIPGAIDWLAASVYGAPRAKVGRNDPCPCGSGKKSKKCCAG